MKLWDDEWDLYSRLLLLTPDEFESLPDGTIVKSITGTHEVKGAPHSIIDMDTRFGHLAWGLPIKMQTIIGNRKK